MDPAGTPKQQQDLEIWREPWEKEMAKLSPDGRVPFPDPRRFNIATHARKIIDLLEEHGIPCCVTGIKALCYYGAPRLCTLCSAGRLVINWQLN
jgi:predicted TIM-barrel fold metal-dependent hydrolase